MTMRRWYPYNFWGIVFGPMFTLFNLWVTYKFITSDSFNDLTGMGIAAMGILFIVMIVLNFLAWVIALASQQEKLVDEYKSEANKMRE